MVRSLLSPKPQSTTSAFSSSSPPTGDTSSPTPPSRVTLAYATDHWQFPRFKHAIIIIAIAASYGIAMEAGQHFLPHRSPFLISDAVVNTVGASGVLCWYLVRPYFELRPVSDYFDSSS